MNYKKTNKVCPNCNGRVVFDCENSRYRCLNCEAEFRSNESDELAVDSIYSNKKNKIGIIVSMLLFLKEFAYSCFLYRTEGIDSVLHNSIILIIMAVSLTVIIYNLVTFFYFNKQNELFICMPIRFDYYRELGIYQKIGKKKNIKKTVNTSGEKANKANKYTKDFKVYSQWKYYINNTYKDYKEYSDFYRYLKQKLRYKKVISNLYSVLVTPVVVMMFSGLMNGEPKYHGLSKEVIIVIWTLIILVFMTIHFNSASQEENYLNDLIEVLFGSTLEKMNRESLKDTYYYVVIDGRQMGPFGTNDISTFIKNGTLTADTLIWKKGMKEWAKAGSAVEMCSLFLEQEKFNPPPLPITEQK